MAQLYVCSSNTILGSVAFLMSQKQSKILSKCWKIIVSLSSIKRRMDSYKRLSDMQKEDEIIVWSGLE